MKCPKCEDELIPSIDPGKSPEYQDITFECTNGHRFFIRVKVDELMED